MAFATYEDIEARWRPLSDDEQARATVLLDDAAIYLSSFVDIDQENEEQQAILKMVSCSIVQRSMIAAEADVFGVDKQTITADIYSQSVSYSNPSGDFYLTRSEKQLLGITGSYLIGVRPTISPVKVEWHEDTWRDR